MNDADAIALEREKAAKNRGKYGGVDKHGFTTSSVPSSGSGLRLGATTTAASTPGGGSTSANSVDHDADSTTASAAAARVQDMSLTDGAGGGTGAGSPRSSAAHGGAASPAWPSSGARPKPKLSSLKARCCATLHMRALLHGVHLVACLSAIRLPALHCTLLASAHVQANAPATRPSHLLAAQPCHPALLHIAQQRCEAPRRQSSAARLQVDPSMQAAFKSFASQQPGPSGLSTVQLSAPSEPQSQSTSQNAAASAQAAATADEQAAADHGLNLLNFDDDPADAPVPEPAQAGTNGADDDDDEDWADFGGADEGSAADGGGLGGDPFSGANGAAGAAAQPGDADPFADFAAAQAAPPAGSVTGAAASGQAGVGAGTARPALAVDDFAEPLPAAPPQLASVAGGGVQPAPGAAPLPAAAAFEPFDSAAQAASSEASTTAGPQAAGAGHARNDSAGGVFKEGAIKDKNDPFADLLG